MLRVAFIAQLVLLVTCAISLDIRADDNEDNHRIRRAVLNLRDDIFDNCIIKFQVDFSEIRNDKIDLSGFGKYVLGRRDSLALSDVSTTLRAGVLSDGRTRAESIRYHQNYVSKINRNIYVSYDVVKSERKVTNVSYDPKSSYTDNYHGLARGVRLDCILSSFGPFPENIVDIVNVRLPIIKRNSSNLLNADYPTEYGRIEATIETLGKRDRLIEMRITQSAKDIYTHLSKGATLAEIRQSVLRETPQGLTSVIHGFRISYDDASKRPFNVITVFDSYVSEGKIWKSERVLRVTDYQKCLADSEIEALRIPVAEGEIVGLMDPSKKDMIYTYRNGDIVRQVDGASLEEVAVEERSHKMLIYIAISLCGFLCITFGTLYIWKRRIKSKVKSP